MQSDTPSSRRLEKAGFIVAIVVAVLMVLFFVMRGFWHAEVQADDPASLNAPDATNEAPVSAPLEIE